MFLQFGAIFTGLIISYFLKDFQFLSLELHFLSKGVVFPDFLLIFVIYFALNRSELSGIWVGFFAGMLEDSANWIFNPHSGMNANDGGGYIAIIGIHALVYTLMGFLVARLKTIYENKQVVVTIVFSFFTVLLARFFTWTLHGFVDNFNLNYPIVGPAFYTALITPFWFTILGWLYRY